MFQLPKKLTKTKRFFLISQPGKTDIFVLEKWIFFYKNEIFDSWLFLLRKFWDEKDVTQKIRNMNELLILFFFFFLESWIAGMFLSHNKKEPVCVNNFPILKRIQSSFKKKIPSITPLKNPRNLLVHLSRQSSSSSIFLFREMFNSCICTHTHKMCIRKFV